MENKKKVMLILIPIVAIIVAGILMICLKGFNYSLLYSNIQRLNIYMDKEFNVEDIKTITNEVFGDKQVKVQKANQFGTVVSIVTSEITEEEQKSIIEKINTKYEITLDKETDIALMNIPQARAWDLVKIYVSPLLTITLISIAYMAIRFRKNGIIKSLVEPAVSLVLIIALYVSVVAIVRIPVNEFFVILGMLIYILTIICNAMRLSKAEN